MPDQAGREATEFHQPCGGAEGESHGGPDDRHCFICSDPHCRYNQPDAGREATTCPYRPRDPQGVLWTCILLDDHEQRHRLIPHRESPPAREQTPPAACPRCWRPMNEPGAQTCNRPHASGT